jgi:hypothetical protein
MMSDNKDNQVATTSKEIREGDNNVHAEMDEVMNAVDEEMRVTENNPEEEEEELMVSLDSRKRKLSQQLSTTPLQKQKQIDDDHIHKMSFFSLPQLNKKSEQNTIPTKIGVSLTLPQWKVLCSATQVVDDLISRVKDGEPVDWRYDLGEDSTSSSKPLN